MRGPIAAAVFWARSTVRHRWPSLLVLGLLAGITGGLALGCIDGARRTGTALDRLRERTRATDAIVFATQVGLTHPDWRPLAAEPEVEELAPWALVFGQLDDDPDGLLFAPVDDAWLNSVDRPRMTDGRMFDAGADDEMVVSDALARAEGISVGETMAFTPLTETEMEERTGPGAGPRIELRVVGLVQTSMESLVFTGGFGAVSPGLLTQHPEVASLQNANIRLRSTPGALAALQRHANTDIADGVPVLDVRAVARRVTTTTDVERTALLALAVAIALAGVVLVGQATSRSAAAISSDADALRGIGLSRSTMAIAAMLSRLPAAVVAAAACIGTAAALSTALPFGVAEDLDPDPGLHLDAIVALPGTILVGIAVLGATWLAALRATRRRSLRPAGERTGVGGWVRCHSSPTVGIGTALALGGAGDTRGTAARPALVGVVVGIMGIAGAVTVDTALHDSLAHPERAGVVWDAQVSGSQGGPLDPTVVNRLSRLPEVADATMVRRALVPVNEVGVPAYAVEPSTEVDGIALTVIDGRSPQGPGEVAVGPTTASTLHLSIGDRVPVGSSGAPRTVVGIALFPTDVHSEFDEGIWLTPTDLDAAMVGGSQDSEIAPGADELAAVRFAPGVDSEAGVAALQVAIGAGSSDLIASPVDVPPELLNLRDIVPLPRWLAAFLAALAVAALLHVLTSTARIRAHDFAVLRALGVTRRGTRMVLHAQSTATFVVGLLVGMPSGLVVGRVAWRLLAASIPLRLVNPLAVVALVLLVPGALLVAQLVAVDPGRRVLRLRPAEVLRTE